MVKILNLIFVSNLTRDQNEQKLNVEIKELQSKYIHQDGNCQQVTFYLSGKHNIHILSKVDG